MSVYVDKSQWPYRNMIMCHMMADSLLELHQMADKICVKRQWFQGDHYDICKAKREWAIRYGAIAVTTRQMVKLRKRLREKISQVDG